MPRERSPNRYRAFEIWRESKGEISNREIAHQLGISEKTVGGWKAKDRWIEQLNGVLQTRERSTPKRAGAPKHNQNAVGNIGELLYKTPTPSHTVSFAGSSPTMRTRCL
ncbi:phage terminase small subunit-related protein [Alicyclobacillus fastidiosus]|uniref:phage terminase small subunit-related protein n=1 Tax=Alicyclobacillus fastidiosus TaxID=392011 RepID=UPI0024E14E74|nr:phage terminase small subunit-related protein [Alicyclobacillus fastidiosus]